MMNYSFPTINPEIWDKYIAPAGLKALETGVNLPVIKQGLEGIEAIHRRGVVPIVSRALEPLPFKWQETGPQEDKAWWDAVGRFQQGRVVPSFDQYITPEGAFSPSGAFEQFQNINPLTNIGAMIGENINLPMEFEADTMRKQNIDIESQKREAQLGRPLSVSERRQVGEDLYKLPPYTRGIAEELPYFAIPPARVMRTGLQSLRTGPRLSSFSTATGAARPLARPARGVVRGAEIALKPLEVMEEAIARAVVAPFRFAATGIATVINRNQVNGLIERIAIDANQIRVMSEGIEDVPTQKIVDGANERFKRYTDIDDEVFILQDGVIVRNTNVVIPPRINIRAKSVVDDMESLATQRATREMIPPTAEEAVMGRRPSPSDTPAARVPEAVTPDLVLYRGTKAGVGQVEQGLTDTGVLPFGEGVLHTTPSEQLAKSFGEDVAKYNVNVRPNEIWDMDAPLSSFSNKRLLYQLAGEMDTIPKGADPQYTPRFEDWNDEAFDDAFDSLGELYERHVQGEFGSYADTNDILRKNGIKLIKATDPMEEVGILDTSILDEIVEPTRGITPQPSGVVSPRGVGAIPESDLVDPFGGRPLDNITPENMDRGAQQELVRSTGDASGHDTARDIIQDDAVREAVDSSSKGGRIDDYVKGREGLAEATSRLNPFSADVYVTAIGKLHDTSWGWRQIVDHLAKTNDISITPQEAFDIGGDLNVVTAAQLSEGSLPRAIIALENLWKTKLEPLLGKQVGDKIGVQASDMSRLIQARHYKTIIDDPELPLRTKENLPVPIDANTGLPVENIRNPDGSYRDVLEWEPYMRENMAPDEFARVEKGAEALRDLYKHERDRLVNAGIFSREVADEWATKRPWYHPIAYIEWAEKTGNGLGTSSSPYSNVSSGVFSMSDNVEVMGALDPLSTDTLMKQLVQNELRLRKNTIGKMVVELAGRRLGWLKDITKEFELPNGIAKAIPYNQKNKQGYLSVFVDGKRKVYGGIGPRLADGSPAPLDKYTFDFIFGKGGLASKGNYELENMWGWIAGMRRGTLTTYNPLFMTRNGVLDMFTVWLKRGVAPPGVVRQILKNFDAMTNDADNVLVDIARTGGFLQSRTTNISTQARSLQARINKAGFDADVIWNEDLTRSTKWRNKIDDFFERGPVRKAAKKTGRRWSGLAQNIEQAARLEVAERTIIARLGRTEWERIKGLSREEFVEELLYNYRGTPGRGLADHPAIREAGMAALDSTVNFFRGGEYFRRINPYTYFVNAAMEGSKLPLRAIGVNLHPNAIPIENPVPGGPYWSYGNYREGLKRGVTGRGDDLDISRISTSGDDVLDSLKYKHARDTVPILETFDTFLEAGSYVVKGTRGGGANAAMMRMGGVLAAQTSIMGWNLMHADEWGYWDIPGWIKYSGLLILLPPKRGEDGEYLTDPSTGKIKPNFFVIPHRTREWSLLLAAPQYIMEKIATSFSDTPEGKTDFKRFAKALLREMTPVDNLPVFGGDDLISNIAKPFVELREITEELQGRDFWRDEPIVPYDLQYRDTADQYMPYTSPVISKIANIIPEGQTYSSPMRLDHLYNNIFGGTGKVAMSAADWILETIDSVHRKAKMIEPTTVEEQVAHYRSLKTTSERRAYKAVITRQGIDVLEAFEDELRKPKRELNSIPFLSDLAKSYNPPYSGGIRELGEIQREEYLDSLGFDYDKDQHAQLSVTFKRIRTKNYDAQQNDDKELLKWTKQTPSSGIVGITPTQWRKRRSERYSNYDFFQKQMVEIFGDKTIYNLSEDERANYYSALYEFATKAGIQDIRLQSEMLIAGYYNIRYPEGDDPDMEQVNKFYQAREEYIEGIRYKFGANSKEFKEFENLRQSHMTAAEKAYDKARTVMQEYFAIGDDPDTFAPTATEYQKSLWRQYLLLEGQEKAGFEQQVAIQTLKTQRDMQRRNHVMKTVDANGKSNLDFLLAFWYGDTYYSKKAVTKEGRDYISNMYGAIIPQRQQAVVR